MVTLKKWTVDELLGMEKAGLLDPEKKIELIDGEVYEMSIGEDHAGVVRRLSKVLERTYGDGAVISVQNPIRMGNSGLPQPDFALLRPREDLYAKIHPKPEDVLLVIEVADSSLKYDRGKKLRSYAQNGIAEVWIVNLSGEQTEVYREPSGNKYREQTTVDRGQSVAPLAFPNDPITPL